MNRLSWDEYFIEMAHTAALRSDCERNQVGAIIVNSRKKIKGTGYNNTPAGCKSCDEKYKECYRKKNNIPSGTRYETCRSIHAEQNAIIQAGESNCAGSSIYIYGHNMICILCKRFILNAGIEKVFLREEESKEMFIVYPEDWKEDL